MKTDVAIVGGGPAGSACAIQLARHGLRSIIIEQDSFPRFHIGESLTEQSGSLLREMGFEEEMERRKYPVKYGVAIYGPAGRAPFWVPIMKRDPVHGLQDSFTWQVRRSTFDRMLLERAQDCGAKLVVGKAIAPSLLPDGSIPKVAVQSSAGNTAEVESDIFVDASGQGTFLANGGIIGPKELGKYYNQIAIFSHFKGAERDHGDRSGNTLVFFQKRHYWAWFIPIDETVTSIGFVVPSEYFRSCRESKVDFIARELRSFNQELGRRCKNLERTEEVRAITNYSYHIREFSGKDWLCIGDAHRFIDPLFSFGVGNALSEARYAAKAIHSHLRGENGNSDRPFLHFEQWSENGTNACQTVLDGFWQNTFAWGMLLARHRDDIIDLLAGRVWEGRDYPALMSMRELVVSS